MEVHAMYKNESINNNTIAYVDDIHEFLSIDTLYKLKKSMNTFFDFSKCMMGSTNNGKVSASFLVAFPHIHISEENDLTLQFVDEKEMLNFLDNIRNYLNLEIGRVVSITPCNWTTDSILFQIDIRMVEFSRK